FAGYSGYAYRTSETSYQYVDRNSVPTAGTNASCTDNGVAVLPGSRVLNVPLGQSGLKTGRPVLLFQRVSYVFRESTLVPGRIGLWRRVHHTNAVVEELGAPFAATAGFGY